ncbi:chemotaxis protein CheW [Idiomarina seosinensis]|uniref:Chemotaxis protein CheW n=1 Tax=Idiomarina seosinensis TaxID=281739 RepID=A0A432ZGD4_9GAMM|nr:chemotaxis protein CheW [Idiomarina seosinensis]RUO77065.1 chemotaxis protein CheW [Idiomarina seosinensis]
MSGSSDKAMMEYLNALLEEEHKPVADFDDEPVKRLLSQATILEIEPAADNEEVQVPEIAVTTPVAEPVETVEEPEQVEEIEQLEQPLETAEQSVAADESLATQPDAMEEYQQGDFQALFFRVAGLTLAVPLKSLGGIHTIGKISPIFGKPKWFKGIMTERDEKLQVVDTARWVMPEKLTPELQEKINYQYLITLSDSPWGLLCEELVDSEPLQPEAIQWRQGVNEKRPWLAGVVRQRMCALLDVNALITLLDNGLGHIQSEPSEKPE